jgi:hypothetical protein
MRSGYWRPWRSHQTQVDIGPALFAYFNFKPSYRLSESIERTLRLRLDKTCYWNEEYVSSFMDDYVPFQNGLCNHPMHLKCKEAMEKKRIAGNMLTLSSIMWLLECKYIFLGPVEVEKAHFLGCYLLLQEFPV